MIIRELRDSDRAQWGSLWAGYLEFYESTLAIEVTECTWRRLIDPAEPMIAMVAEESGCLRGFAHCVLHRGTWAINDLCYLEDLFVSHGARGNGVGRALIEGIYGLADKNEWDRVYWLTHSSNAAARQLYERVARNLGFIQYRR